MNSTMPRDATPQADAASQAASGEIVWVHGVKALAIGLVVLVHAAALVLRRYGAAPMADWWVADILTSLGRICVPLFFMASGVLLLGRHEDLGVFYRKRIHKVVIPAIFWTMVYLLWARLYRGNDLSLHSLSLRLIVPAYYHLWFLYAIIGIYLVLPILRVLVQHAPRRLLWYFAGLWGIAVSVMPVAASFAGQPSQIDLSVVSGYAGYFVLGWLLGTCDISALRRRGIALLLAAFLGLIAVTAAGAQAVCAATRQSCDYGNYFHDYLSLNIIAAAAAVFLIIRASCSWTAQPHSARYRLVRRMSTASFGIYLIHPMILDILSWGRLGFRLSGVSGDALWAIPLTTAVAGLLSFAAIVLMQQSPLLRRIVP